MDNTEPSLKLIFLTGVETRHGPRIIRWRYSPIYNYNLKNEIVEHGRNDHALFFLKQSNKKKVWGCPVVATNLLRTNSLTDKTEALMVNRNAAIIGDRRIFVIKSSDEVLIRSDQLLIVASERLAFAAQYSEAVNKITNIGD